MLQKLYGIITYIAQKISKDHITIYSAQASFYLIISVFPFLMLLFSLAGFLIPVSKDVIITSVQGFMPELVKPAISTLADELFAKSISAVSFSAIVSLWTASKGIRSVERGIKRVYKTPKRHSFIGAYIESVIYTVMLIVVLMLTLILQVFGNTLLDLFGKFIHFPASQLVFFKGFLIFVIISLVSAFLYYIFDRRRKKFKEHIIGALFSGLGWIIFSNLFSLYIDNFENYSYIYGSLTAIVLLMLWVYFCMIILLLGAEINNIIYTSNKK